MKLNLQRISLFFLWLCVGLANAHEPISMSQTPYPEIALQHGMLKPDISIPRPMIPKVERHELITPFPQALGESVRLVREPAREERPSTLDAFTSCATSPLGCFAAVSEADCEIEAMLSGPDEEVDLALASFLIASELPRFRNISRDQFHFAMERAASQVAEVIRCAASDPRIAARRPNPVIKVFEFCDAVRTLGMDYNDAFKFSENTPQQVAALYRDERNIFLPALLATRKGSCVSIPMLYLCIGRKLGYPVYMVNIGKHSFIRWQDGEKHRNDNRFEVRDYG